MEKYLVDVLYVVRALRRNMFHPTLDGVVDFRDANVGVLLSYVDLIGEGPFYTILQRINRTFLLAYDVCFQKYEYSFEVCSSYLYVLISASIYFSVTLILQILH